MTSNYQQEHYDAFALAYDAIHISHQLDRSALATLIQPYIDFRRSTADFLTRHFSILCTRQCYNSRISACCTREGIIAFWGDVVVNVVHSAPSALVRLIKRLQRPNAGFKCVYLDPSGCCWQIKPLVCEMFLCDRAIDQVLAPQPELMTTWQQLKAHSKTFSWPDRPVLFDTLEARFMAAGLQSSLMYLHNSPGLLRVKRQAGWAS